MGVDMRVLILGPQAGQVGFTRLGQCSGFVRFLLLLLPVANFAAPLLSAQPVTPNSLDYTRGASALPRFWRPYQTSPIPPPNLSNTTRLSELIHDGKLELSVAEFLRLVVENNWDLAADRYTFLVAQTDMLRAKSGQAARGLPQVPIPGGLFAGAIGAGLGNTANVTTGGTGATAITGAAKQVVVGPRGGFDPTFSMNFSFDRVVSPLNTLRVSGTPTVTVPSTVLQTRYQQQLSFGTGFSVSFNMQRQSSTQNFLLYNPAYTSLVSFAVYQPLLNGFGFAVNRRFLTVTANNRQISREIFHQQLTQSFSNNENLYWDFVALRENVRVAGQAVALAQRLVEDDEKELAAGMMAPIDVVQAGAQLAASRRDLVVAQTNLQMQAVRLKSVISKSISPQLASAEILPTDSLPQPKDSDVPPLNEALAAALRNRSVLRQAQINIENQKITEAFTRSNLKPTFSIFGLANSFALASNASQVSRQLAQIVYPEYAIGFSLTIPLRNRSAQADNIRARVELQQAEASLQQSRNQIQLQVRTAIVSLVQGKAQVEAAREAVDSSRQALEAEQLRLRIGASTAYRMILAQRDLIAAQSVEVQTRVNYAKALVALNLAMGTSLEKSGIPFEAALRAEPLSKSNGP